MQAKLTHHLGHAKNDPADADIDPCADRNEGVDGNKSGGKFSIGHFYVGSLVEKSPLRPRKLGRQHDQGANRQ
jgi:hypothetical protein